MNKIYIYFSTVLLVLFAGCTDFLEVSPDNRIEPNSLDKVAEMLVAAYPNGDYLFTDWMTDDSQFIETNIQVTRMTDLFKWEEANTDDDNNTVTNYWNESYKAIAQANAALVALDEIDDTDVVRKKAIRGEALACRAYAHFMLVTLFAKEYDPATAASDPGITYMDKPETALLVTYSRNTVKEVYTRIEADLTEALTLISDEYYSGSKKYHFTQRAAKAFACRFYKYKGEFAKSIAFANDILGTGVVSPSLIKNYATYDAQAGSTAKRAFYVSNSDESNILLIEQKISLGLRHSYGYRTGIQYWLNVFYSSGPWGGEDRRLSTGYYGDGSRNTINMAKFDEEFHKESLTATTGEPFFTQAVFRTEEVLLNRAECNLFLGNNDKVLEDLNAFASFRYDGYTEVTLADVQDFYSAYIPGISLEDALLNVMIDERQKEFMQEGMRWFDIKRFGYSIRHITSLGETLTLASDDPRKVLQIPSAAIERGILPNPR
ncbi:MAG: hypothetical protein RIS47_567 [Bacteroidota bacterium]|jgi:hypothetical protein